MGSKTQSNMQRRPGSRWNASRRRWRQRTQKSPTCKKRIKELHDVPKPLEEEAAELKIKADHAKDTYQDATKRFSETSEETDKAQEEKAKERMAELVGWLLTLVEGKVNQESTDKYPDVTNDGKKKWVQSRPI